MVKLSRSRLAALDQKFTMPPLSDHQREKRDKAIRRAKILLLVNLTGDLINLWDYAKKNATVSDDQRDQDRYWSGVEIDLAAQSRAAAHVDQGKLLLPRDGEQFRQPCGSSPRRFQIWRLVDPAVADDRFRQVVEEVERRHKVRRSSRA